MLQESILSLARTQSRRTFRTSPCLPFGELFARYRSPNGQTRGKFRVARQGPVCKKASKPNHKTESSPRFEDAGVPLSATKPGDLLPANQPSNNIQKSRTTRTQSFDSKHTGIGTSILRPTAFSQTGQMPRSQISMYPVKIQRANFTTFAAGPKSWQTSQRVHSLPRQARQYQGAGQWSRIHVSRSLPEVEAGRNWSRQNGPGEKRGSDQQNKPPPRKRGLLLFVMGLAQLTAMVGTSFMFPSSMRTSRADAKPDIGNGVSGEEETIIKSTYVGHMNDLRSGEHRGKFYTASGDVVRCYGVQHGSNSPCEDEMVHERIESTGPEKWAYWAVFDGHAGGATSKFLKSALIPEVAKNLAELREEADSAEDNIKATFRKVDDQIIERGLQTLHAESGQDSEESKSLLAKAYNGSCALLAMFDPTTSSLRVACTGDSRAVLGHYDPNESAYKALPMSIDQNGKNPTEAERLARDHPGEDKIINPRSGRVFGIAISRAFGDARWKWSEEDSLLAREKYGGPNMRGLGPPGSIKTPPYLTAEPEIREHVVRMGKDVENADFLILASDGFFDHISSKDAVECVANWVKAQACHSKSGSSKAPPAIVGGNDPRLRSAYGEASPIKWPLRKGSGEWGNWHVDPSDFVYEEHNAATHLVQNAFGGRKRGLFCGAMAEQYPMSRWARDDISVYVIFFGKVGGKSIVDEPELRVL